MPKLKAGMRVRSSRTRSSAAPDLGQLAARPPPGQRQRGIGPAGDHHVQPRRQMVEQERHPVLHIARVDDVVVVEHQHDVARDGAQVVEQRGKHRLDRGRPGRLQEGQRTLADPGCRRPQRGDHIGPEGRGIVVAPVEREPRGQPLIGRPGRSRRQPLGEQCGLAEASGRGDEHQLRRGPAIQPLGSGADAAPDLAVTSGRRTSSRAGRLARGSLARAAAVRMGAVRAGPVRG